MKDFTTHRPDGFGAQLNAILVGYLVARQNFCQYLYTPMTTLKLLKVGNQNKQLREINGILVQMADKLGLRRASGNTYILPRPEELYPHCNDNTFRGDAARDLKSCWPLESPFSKPTLIIHVRRGGDIDPSHEHRWQTTDFVNDIVRRCVKTYPNHEIKVLCWGDPEIDPSLQVTIDTTSEGGDILDHFNQMVHADVLILAHSSFGLSAGLLSNGTVICPPSILRTKHAHHPKEWDDNWSLLCNE